MVLIYCSGNGVTCVYLGACHINNGGCSLMAACVEMANIVRCFCPPGYTGAGETSCSFIAKHCIAVLGVGPMGCMPGQAVGPAGPVAPTPSPDHGMVLSPCAQTPCANGGTCIPSAGQLFHCKMISYSIVTIGGQYVCQCMYGWTGQNCNQRQNWCASSPCHNGATCVSGDQGFSCHCAEGFTGHQCQEEVSVAFL